MSNFFPNPFPFPSDQPVEEGDLRIKPALLICRMNHVVRCQMSHEKGRLRIVMPHIFPYPLRVGVGVTVPAQMPAGIVGTDIASHQTAAEFPLALSLRDNHPSPQSPLVDLLRHTSPTVHAVRFQLPSLSAGLHAHSAGGGDPGKSLAQFQTVLPVYRKVL